jgi:tetratricopeptide (TPR) repeat protein
LILCAAVVAAAVVVGRLAWQHRADRDVPRGATAEDAPPPAAVTIDYPADESIFPPEISPPTFLWHDAAGVAVRWQIDVAFADGSAALRAESSGEPPRIGEIDPRCVAETNQPPRLTPYEAAARTWTPDGETWAAIKRHSGTGPATVTISGIGGPDRKDLVSRGSVTIRTSQDPVGAPIFYRDVPLMPAELKKGVIQPLSKNALPMVAWRLRDVGEPRSRLLLTGLHTCANCHSFSRDGKTLGMDVDGPSNDKGTYAIAPIRPQMSIRPEDVITWNSFSGQPRGHRTIGFMAQLSPDGRYAVVTLNEALYVANFKDYRFLQVFYPTRGILGFYDRESGAMQALPGADDPRYVQTGAVWSPDGKYLVFARAEAADPYPEGRKPAQYAGDPNELPMQYDLYRIPFSQGQGGRAEPIAGASRNGMSNSFPKISPDGRWIVFVQCRNGQLMRPDGKLYIVPAEGGQARLLRCNTRQMNSWHSFSPNGRWLVFASKSRSPYTQMFLTHLDEEGRDSPAILIENATAANRAVNIPEFVNLPPDGLNLLKIDVPAAEVYRLFDLGMEQAEQGQDEQAIASFRGALAVDPEYAEAHNSLANVLARRGRADEAVAHYRKVLELKPGHVEPHNNLGIALAGRGQVEEAIAHYQQALEIKPDSEEAHYNLGNALAGRGRVDEAVAHYQKALETKPDFAEAHNNLANVLAGRGRIEEAIAHYRQALEIKPDYAEAHLGLGAALAGRGRVDEAIAHYRKALDIKPDYAEAHNNLANALLGRGQVEEAIAHYRQALEIKPDYAAAHFNLGNALASHGQVDEAIAHYQKALDLASARNDTAMADVIRARIKLHQSVAPAGKAP